MPYPYIGEIKMFAGTYAPAGWEFCNGQMLPIAENETLFTLIGTTYGGDGQETFALPNLQSRIPIHMSYSGSQYQLADMAGTEVETLSTQQIPVHNHAFLSSTSPGNVSSPLGNVLAKSTTRTPYAPALSAPANLTAASIGVAGGSQPHSNLQPFLCVHFIISLFGEFPRFN